MSTESRIDKIFGILVGLFVLGISLIVVGVVLKLTALTSLGAATTGASFGTIFGRFANKDIRDEIRGMLAKQWAGFTSEPTDIKKFFEQPIILHLYHMTKCDFSKDGTTPNIVTLWRHSIIDFSHCIGSNRLVCSIEFPHPSSNEKNGGRYKLEAGIREGRMIVLLSTQQGSEPCAVMMVDLDGSAYSPDLGGLQFHQTFQSTNSISPVMITRNPIKDDEPIGTVATLFSESYRVENETEYNTEKAKFSFYTNYWKNCLNTSLPENNIDSFRS